MHVAGEYLARDEAERDDGQVDPFDRWLLDKARAEIYTYFNYLNVLKCITQKDTYCAKKQAPRPTVPAGYNKIE